MTTRGSKVERHSVSEQPHELKYEAKKTGTSTAKVETAKNRLVVTSAARSKIRSINNDKPRKGLY